MDPHTPGHASRFLPRNPELIDKDVSLILFKAKMRCARLQSAWRISLLPYTEKMTVLDTAEFELPGISREVSCADLADPARHGPERISAHLEVMRHHPLTTRRYYKSASAY